MDVVLSHSNIQQSGEVIKPSYGSTKSYLPVFFAGYCKDIRICTPALVITIGGVVETYGILRV